MTMQNILTTFRNAVTQKIVNIVHRIVSYRVVSGIVNVIIRLRRCQMDIVMSIV